MIVRTFDSLKSLKQLPTMMMSWIQPLHSGTWMPPRKRNSSRRLKSPPSQLAIYLLMETTNLSTRAIGLKNILLIGCERPTAKHHHKVIHCKNLIEPYAPATKINDYEVLKQKFELFHVTVMLYVPENDIHALQVYQNVSKQFPDVTHH